MTLEEVVLVLFRIAVAGAGVFIAWNAYIFRSRAEKWQALKASLEERRDINKLIIADDNNLSANEDLMTGVQPSDLHEARKRFMAFLWLNKALYLYRAMNEDLIDEEVALREIDATVSLLLKNYDLIKELLENRGYTKGFRNYILGRMTQIAQDDDHVVRSDAAEQPH